MSDIFREVDEEIRKEHYAALWKKYGPWVIGAAVLVVLVVAGYQGWQAYQRDRALTASDRYSEAISQLDAGNTGAALDALQQMAEPDSESYGLLAAFRVAELKLDQDDTDAAIDIWNRISASAAAPRPMRDLATLFVAMNRLESGDPASLNERLQALVTEESAFKFTAMELQALLARRQGDDQRAMELFRQIADAAEVPPAQRRRATQMIALLEG